ncbi:hypothetical protein Egran_04555 [Elaphomyces granulatus]|uniref:Polarized growth protein Boi2 n=1 Tax=Elaphomyces granulatus TaxID=519963 RepID=A0A232LU34_9EURO|nr:hypothetical protein Egran_04555 [Elaphomyces granulatus]
MDPSFALYPNGTGVRDRSPRLTGLWVDDFDARGVDELTLRRGDKIEVVELDEGFGDGWYLGKHVGTGKIGLFPGVYTAATPKIPVRKQVLPSKAVDSELRFATQLVVPATDVVTPPMSPMLPVSSMSPVSPISPTSLKDVGFNGETTPQASRQPSEPDMDPTPAGAEMDAASPKLPQRSSSAPLPPSAPLAAKPIREALTSPPLNEDSPVMNETLSVIDEHITDLNTPRHSVATPEEKAMTDSGSEYSSNYIGQRVSYIHEHETDEEEQEETGAVEEQVRGWDHVETARQLRDLGMEAKHCDIFEQQEITGDVLLEMDQEFIFMKEFDFGVMGRRLKTWHMIKAFQEGVKGLKPPREHERSMSRAGNAGPLLPRIPSFSEKQSFPFLRSRSSAAAHPPRRVWSQQLRNGSGSPPTARCLYGRDPVVPRPSAASARDLHPRRHSSIDTTCRPPALSGQPPVTMHQKQGSFDRSWTMALGSQQPPASRHGSAVEATDDDIVLQQRFLEEADANGSESVVPLANRLDALDRGYFSGGELETRRTRKVLRKRDVTGDGIAHSRDSSYVEDDLRTGTSKRYSRISSTGSIQESASHVSPAAMAYSNSSSKGRISGSSDRPSQRTCFPTVTNIQTGFGPSVFTPFAPLSNKSEGENSGRSSPMYFYPLRNVAPKFRRVVGLRAASDNIVGGDKPMEICPSVTSPIKEMNLISSRTGSTTPSATSKSSGRQSTDGSGKASEGVLPVTRPKISRVATKPKKHTSAYMRGLEKKMPQEQMMDCDYSGWMRKKSSNLMTIWKPRLFVLRGRRLSYYYSESDTEERGLIDIAAHRVLRADQDPITNLHATITGAKGSPTSTGAKGSPTSTGTKGSPTSTGAKGSPTSPATTNGVDTGSSSQEGLSDGTIRSKAETDTPFIFKLVPPKSGSSRTVQFTKPATHYFQVDNIQEGRLWMAALMKATIEIDLSRPVDTTNKQKTISLKQAQAMNQRPPTLMDAPEKDPAASDLKDDDTGFEIKGLPVEEASPNAESSVSDCSSSRKLGSSSVDITLCLESQDDSVS